MSAESCEVGLEARPERESILAIVAARLKTIESRFPAISQSMLSIADQAIVSGTSFVSAVIIGRMTSADELGLYYLVLSIVMVATAIEDSAVFAPFVVYSKRRGGNDLAEYTGSIWLQMLSLSVLSIGLLLAMIGVLTATGHTGVVPGLWILCIAGPLILVRNGVRRFAFAKLHVWTATVLDAMVAALQLGTLLVLSYFDRLNVMTIFATMGGACALASVGACLLDPPQLRVEWGRVLADWRHNWTFAKWTLRSYLLGFTAPYVLLWILGLTSGPAAAALLGMCSTIIGMTNVPVMGVDNVLTPQATHAFATLGKHGLWPILLRTGAILTTVLGGLLLFVVLTGDWLTVLFFGAGGDGTEWILAALAASALMNGISTVAGNGLWAIDQPRPSFIADLASMTCTLLAAAVFVPSFGALGAAMATFVGMAVAATVRVLLLVRCLHSADCVPRPHHDADASGDEDSRFVMESAEAAI